MIPEGIYRAKTLTAALGETKSGKEQMAIDFGLVDGPSAGQRITWYGGFMSDKAVEYTVKALRACGWKGDDLSAVGELAEEVEIVVQHEDYEGQMRAKVKYVNPLGGAARNAMAADKAKAFAARMKARIAQVGKAAPSQREEPPPHSDSDLPF